MAESANQLFVARPEDLNELRERASAALGGAGRMLLLQAPVGGGKRALTSALARELSASEEDQIILRSTFTEEENGVQTLIRLYATLYSTLHREPMLRGKVEMVLNAQIPKVERRIQGWFQAFIEGMKKGAPAPGEDKIQVTLPRDNPALGLVHVLLGISKKIPVLIDIQNFSVSQSLMIHSVFQALAQSAAGHRLFVVASVEPADESARLWFPPPLLQALEEDPERFDTLSLESWGEAEVGQYLESKGLEADRESIVRLSGGRPGFIAEIINILEERGQLAAASEIEKVWDLLPMDLDEEELDDEAEAAEGRSRVGAKDLREVVIRAGLLGRAFPSGLLADIHGYDRDSVDDLLDAASDLFEEMQFAKGLNTWIYQFSKALWWHAASEALSEEETAELCTRTANFLERTLVPRGYEFLIRTLRLYARAGNQRAVTLRALTMSSEPPESWTMTYNLLQGLPDLAWSDAMRKTVYVNLLERMAGTGDVNQAEKLFGETLDWATKAEDRAMQAWVLLLGSKLDFRREDLYRSRDRAKDALALLEAMEDKLRSAEVLNHLALIELKDGNNEASLENVDKALMSAQITTEDDRKAVPPQVAAQAEFLRGQVRRQEKKWDDAAQHLRQANEIAGRTGQAPLALESGLMFGEVLLRGGKAGPAADALQRVAQIARALKNPTRERAAMQLLSQAQGNLRNYEAALASSQHTLALTRQLKYQRLEPFDLHQVGRYSLLLGKANEALSLLKQARSKANLSEPLFAKELLFDTGTAAMSVGEKSYAREAFTQALPMARQLKDSRKVLGCLEHLGDLAASEGDSSAATEHFTAAVEHAQGANLKEERKRIRQKLARLS